jgi:serine/threonine protein phosphatase 1
MITMSPFVAQAAMPHLANLPPDMVVYAIGDIHGNLSKLQELYEAIDRRIDGHGLPTQIVHLGDYTDRGPDNLGVIDYLRSRPDTGRVTHHFLLGNHEKLLINALIQPPGMEDYRARGRFDHWLENGGGTVIKEIDPLGWSNYDFAALRASFGQDRLAWYDTLRPSVSFGTYLFVHAGIHPNITFKTLDRYLAHQDNDDSCVWVRYPFLRYERPLDVLASTRIIDHYTVVHGHTPSAQPELLAHRIGIDTRAYQTDRLTALELAPEGMRFISTY